MKERTYGFMPDVRFLVDTIKSSHDIISQNCNPEFKKKSVRLHEEEGRTYKSVTAEHGVSKASMSKRCSEFSKECQVSELFCF